MAKEQLNARVSALTRRQLDELGKRWGTTQTETLTVIIDRMYQQEIAMNTPTRITESWLQDWIDANRPELGLLETNGVKGFYRLDAGPAYSFHGVGKTWKQVAAELEAIQLPDAA